MNSKELTASLLGINPNRLDVLRVKLTQLITEALKSDGFLGAELLKRAVDITNTKAEAAFMGCNIGRFITEIQSKTGADDDGEDMAGHGNSWSPGAGETDPICH